MDHMQTSYPFGLACVLFFYFKKHQHLHSIHCFTQRPTEKNKTIKRNQWKFIDTPPTEMQQYLLKLHISMNTNLILYVCTIDQVPSVIEMILSEIQSKQTFFFHWWFSIEYANKQQHLMSHYIEHFNSKGSIFYHCETIF